MKTLLLTTGLLFIICSCDNKSTATQSSHNTQNSITTTPVDSAVLRIEATLLRDLLFADVINLDSVQIHIDNGTDLNFPIKYEFEYEVSPFRDGSLFHALTRSTHREQYEMNSLQSLLTKRNKNYKEALMMLLRAGADPNGNIKTDDDISCLEQALKDDFDLWIIDSLMAYGADPSKVNLALAGDDLKMIDFFVKKGADPATININSFVEDFRLVHPRNRGWKVKFEKVLAYNINPQVISPWKIAPNGPRINSFVLDKLVEKGLDFNKPAIGLHEEYWLRWTLEKNGRKTLAIYLLEHGATKCHPIKSAYEIAESRGYDQELLDLIEAKLGK